MLAIAKLVLTTFEPTGYSKQDAGSVSVMRWIAAFCAGLAAVLPINGTAYAHVEPDEFRLLAVDPDYVVEISESHLQLWPEGVSSGSAPLVRFRVLSWEDDRIIVEMGDAVAEPCPGQTVRGAELFESVISRTPRDRVSISLSTFEARIMNRGEIRAFYRDNLPAVFEYTENCALDDRTRLIYHEQEIDLATGESDGVSGGSLQTISWYVFFAGNTALAIAARQSHEDIELPCSDAQFKALLLEQFQQNATCSVGHRHGRDETRLRLTANSHSPETGEYSAGIQMGYLYADSETGGEDGE